MYPRKYTELEAMMSFLKFYGLSLNDMAIIVLHAPLSTKMAMLLMLVLGKNGVETKRKQANQN